MTRLKAAVLGICMVVCVRCAADVFSVPLTVKENQGIERKAWPASFGVPMPVGVVKEPKELRLLDAGGAEVPCQFNVLSRHWGRGNSLRWVLVCFQPDVPANGSAVYTLTNDRPASPVKDAIKVKETDDAFTASTGKIDVVFSRKKCSLFESVSVGGKPVVKAAEHDGPRATTEKQDFERRTGSRWAAHGWESSVKLGQRPITQADYFGDVGEPDGVVIERAGPMHVVVRAYGTYRPTEKTKDVLEFGPYNFTYRVHLYKGKDYVRVEHSVENSRFQWPRFQVKLLDHSLWTTLALGKKISCAYGGLNGKSETAEVRKGETLSIYGEKAKAVNAQWIDLEGGGMRVGVGTRLHGGDAQAFDVIDGKLAVRPYSIYFGEAHPISSLDKKSWGRNSFTLDYGSRVTYDFYYRFAEKGKGTDLATLVRGNLWPLFGFASPQWYADAAVWNMDLHPDNSQKVRRGGGVAADKPYDPYGKDAAGRTRRSKWSFNSGGHHGNLSSLNDAALMHADLNALQGNYNQTNMCIDFFQWNYRGHDPTNDSERLKHAHRLILFGPKDLYNWAQTGVNPGTGLCGYKYLPDFEHYAFLWLWEHYYLWGDERAKESLMKFANFSVTFEADVMFWRAGQKNMLPLDQVDFFDKHPAALHISHYARIYSWQLYTPLQAYQATGHPVYDLLTKWQLRRLSHLQRLSRGIPECWQRNYWSSPAQKHWKVVEYPKEVTDFLYRAQSWQIGKTMIAFHEAYRIYGDEEILDNLWGEADYFRQVPWQGPGKGIPNGPYIPTTIMGQDKSGKDFNPNYHKRTGQALALAYFYTGDAELKTRMEDHVKNGGLPGSTWGHIPAWVNARKGGRDKAPDAVTDLKCVKAARDGVVFEWTAPKGHGKSGRATTYFLKYSTKPLVKWALVDNPNPPDDPVADKGLHTYKPECWHPDFLKKDAFWMANHVEGEPAPGEPGTRETCTVTIVKPHRHYGLPLDKMPRVKDLPAGAWYFALCSYDEDHNLSDPSNVVEVELK